MTPGADPGRVLRLALLGWGLGHLALGKTTSGWALLVSEVVGLLLVAWLTIGLADSSLYLVPFLAGAGLIGAWAWQAVIAYRSAGRAARQPGGAGRSPAVAVAWLSVPLLAWFAGYWLFAADRATPAAALDGFVAAWTDGRLESEEWPTAVTVGAADAADGLSSGADRFQDVRFTVLDRDDDRARAVAEAVRYERRDSRFLWVFTGSELVPVAQERLLTIELEAVPVELPGGGDVGAVRWEVVAARAS